jgi:hypothetical protein
MGRDSGDSSISGLRDSHSYAMPFTRKVNLLSFLSIVSSLFTQREILNLAEPCRGNTKKDMDQNEKGAIEQEVLRRTYRLHSFHYILNI